MTAKQTNVLFVITQIEAWRGAGIGDDVLDVE
jgi:hypothetical protein